MKGKGIAMYRPNCAVYMHVFFEKLKERKEIFNGSICIYIEDNELVLDANGEEYISVLPPDMAHQVAREILTHIKND